MIPRSNHLVLAAAIACEIGSGCGAISNDDEFAGTSAGGPKVSTAEATVRITRAAESTETFTGTAKLVVDWSGAIANLYGTYQAAEALAQAVGILQDPNQDILQQLQALHQQIDQFAQALDWFMAEKDREDRLSNMRSAVFVTHDDISSGSPVDWSVLDLNTAQTVGQATNATAFLRKRIASDPPNDPLYDNTYVYDWRLGVPALTQLIGLRLQLMAMEDANFTIDRRFHDELMSYHDALEGQLQTMTAGLQCQTVAFGRDQSRAARMNSMPRAPTSTRASVGQRHHSRSTTCIL